MSGTMHKKHEHTTTQLYKNILFGMP